MFSNVIARKSKGNDASNVEYGSHVDTITAYVSNDDYGALRAAIFHILVQTYIKSEKKQMPKQLDGAQIVKPMIMTLFSGLKMSLNTEAEHEAVSTSHQKKWRVGYDELCATVHAVQDGSQKIDVLKGIVDADVLKTLKELKPHHVVGRNVVGKNSKVVKQCSTMKKPRGSFTNDRMDTEVKQCNTMNESRWSFRNDGRDTKWNPDTMLYLIFEERLVKPPLGVPTPNQMGYVIFAAPHTPAEAQSLLSTGGRAVLIDDPRIEGAIIKSYMGNPKVFFYGSIPNQTAECVISKQSTDSKEGSGDGVKEASVISKRSTDSKECDSKEYAGQKRSTDSKEGQLPPKRTRRGF